VTVVSHAKEGYYVKSDRECRIPMALVVGALGSKAGNDAAQAVGKENPDETGSYFGGVMAGTVLAAGQKAIRSS